MSMKKEKEKKNVLKIGYTVKGPYRSPASGASNRPGSEPAPKMASR